MSAQHVNSVILVCDGCETQLDNGATFPSPMDARGRAYSEGWRFPAMLTRTGSLSSRMSSDVCPGCLPSWEPKPIQARAHYRRAGDRSATA